MGWDAVTPYVNGTAFTTAQTFAHTVGGGSNRYIWVTISTEDFSTGGGGQTPSSVTYNGNAMVADGIAISVATQTAAIYSGQDAIMGAAGAHNVVITYAGEVNAIVAHAVSKDNMTQAVKEATGTEVELNTTNTGGTSSITTLTNGAVIIAAAGHDNAAARTFSWNVGTELGEDVTTTVGGAGLRYEKATAGAQDIICTLSGNVTRFCLLSFAYAANTAPVITVPAAQRLVKGVANTITGLSFADAEGGDLTVDIACTSGTLAMGDEGALDVTGSGTTDLQLVGTTTELNAVIDTLTYTQPGKTADTITVDAQDSASAAATQKTIGVTMVDGQGTADNMADLVAVFQNLLINEATAKTVQMTVYARDSGGRTHSVTVPIVVTEAAAEVAQGTGKGGGSAELLDHYIQVG